MSWRAGGGLGFWGRPSSADLTSRAESAGLHCCGGGRSSTPLQVLPVPWEMFHDASWTQHMTLLPQILQASRANPSCSKASLRLPLPALGALLFSLISFLPLSLHPVCKFLPREPSPHPTWNCWSSQWRLSSGKAVEESGHMGCQLADQTRGGCRGHCEGKDLVQRDGRVSGETSRTARPQGQEPYAPRNRRGGGIQGQSWVLKLEIPSWKQV